MHTTTHMNVNDIYIYIYIHISYVPSICMMQHIDYLLLIHVPN